MVSKQPKIAHFWHVVTPWPTQDLLTLDELKVQLRIPVTDVSKDAELTLIIDGVSAQMAMMANRGFGYGFGYHEIEETSWNIVDEDRVFLSHWPVKQADITALTLDGVDILPSVGVKPNGTTYVLEETTGTLFSPFGPWNGTLFAHYSGGYKIPDESPDDLKRAATVAMREDYYTYVRGSVLSGVRMISHKHARVQYYPPGQLAASQAGGGPNALGPTWTAVMNVLNKYIRHWV